MSQDRPRDYGELGPVAYVQTLADESVQTWDRFWFTPRDPIVLGLFACSRG